MSCVFSYSGGCHTAHLLTLNPPLVHTLVEQFQFNKTPHAQYQLHKSPSNRYLPCVGGFLGKYEKSRLHNDMWPFEELTITAVSLIWIEVGAGLPSWWDVSKTGYIWSELGQTRVEKPEKYGGSCLLSAVVKVCTWLWRLLHARSQNTCIEPYRGGDRAGSLSNPPAMWRTM